MSKGLRVLAIAIDSLEPALADRAMAEQRAPTLTRLTDEGTSVPVVSTALMGSGSVWPTFITGGAPLVHGVTNEWRWDPDDMTVHRFGSSELVPFWADLARRGVRLGIFDVPFMPLIGLDEGFEINEWGPHDVLVGHMEGGPGSALAVVRSFDPHPFGHRNLSEEAVATDLLRVAAQGAMTGIELRGQVVAKLIEASDPDVAVIAFPELHHLGHVLWHTVEPHHTIFERQPVEVHTGPTVMEMLTAIDKEIDRLLGYVQEGGSVIVFSLHGMKPARGMPDILPSLLEHDGYSRPATWRRGDLPDRARALFASVKRHTPDSIKALYHRHADQMLQIRLARSTMLRTYDWETTRAFALPTDQHGLTRLNITGRERAGIVPEDHYAPLGDEIEGRLRSLQSVDGNEVIEDIVRPRSQPMLGNRSLPDMFVHWADEAHRPDLKFRDLDIEPARHAQYRTGQHTPHAVCIGVGPAAEDIQGEIPIEELHELIVRHATRP